MRMIRVVIAGGLLLLTAAQAYGQTRLPRGFMIDGEHSSVTFSVPFMGMSTVKGEFSEVMGSILLADDPRESMVTAIIRTKSVNTHSQARDRHLRSPDFLAADSHPVIRFESDRIEPRGDVLIAHGPLTLRGVTRRIALPFHHVNGPSLDAWKNTRVTYRAVLRISRRDYGVRGTAFWNGEFDPGRFAVGDTVDIQLEISATIPNTESWTVPGSDSLATVAEKQGAESMISAYEKADSAARPIAAAALIAGYKLAQRGRTDAAVRVLQWGAERFTHFEGRSLGHSIAGELLLQRGERDRAINAFDQALRIEPYDVKAMAWKRWLATSSTR